MATTTTPSPAKPGQKAAAPKPLTAASIREKWDASQKAAIKERQAFWVNSSFLSGEQWVVWNPTTHTLEQADRDHDRLRLTENRLWPSSRTNIAKLLRRPLVFEVPPTSADDASVDGSRTAGSVLADVHHRHDWEELRRQNAWHTWKGGIAVLSVEWDAKAGTELGVTESGKHFGTGDTVESALTVCEVATEPGVRDIEHASWWIKAAALPPKQVQEMYQLDSEPAADASAALSPLQRQLLGGVSSNGPANIKLTLVLSYFERPGSDRPDGAVAVVVGEQIVDPTGGQPGPWPFPFKDRLNCVAVRETPHDSDWLADTILSAAVSPQVALNHCVSALGEHMKLAGNARMAVPESAGDDWDVLSDAPEIVRYFGPNPPLWMAPPSMPEWWITAPDRFRAAIDDILGVHDVSRGEAPANIHSGVGLSLLAEQDDTPLGQLSKTMAEAWGRLGSLVLAVYEEKVTEKRTATISRPGQAPERVHWTGKDLAGQTTAVVPLDAVAPRSQAAQMQMAFELKQSFPDLDLKTFARIAQLPDAADMTEAVDPDVAKARRENGDMAAGNVVIPAAFDDHGKHIAEHNVFRKSARYEALDEETRQIVDAHVQGHEVDAAQQAGSQLAKANINPALAAAPQANEPPMAGEPDALQQMQQARNQGVAQALQQPAQPGGASAAVDGADGQSTAPAPMGGM